MPAKTILPLHLCVCSWANEDEGKPKNNLDYETVGWAEMTRISNQFYDNEKARSYYIRFVTNMVSHYKSSPYSGLIHSWDICNEPRMRDNDGNMKQAKDNAVKVAKWLHEVAAKVKSLDPKTPVTCGAEGFFKEGTSKCVRPLSSSIDTD